MRIASIITDRSITIVDPTTFVPKAIPLSHPNFAEIKRLVETNAAWDQIKDLVDLPTAISTYTNGRIAVVNGVLTFDGVEVANALSARILQLIGDKKEATAEPLIRFMENVNLNPSMRAVQGLYDWMQKANLPITPDGCIIAWKIVDRNYRDIRTRKFDNSIGNVVQIARNQCDENPNQTCSYGLHFCSSEYLPHYGTESGARVVVVKIHPRDVVAFPNDYNTAKGRCCRYEVIGEVDRATAPDMFAGISVLRDFGQNIDDDNDDELFEELDVGGVYLNRDGDEVEIVELTGNSEFPYRGDNGAVYTASGRYLNDDVDLAGDLIKRVVN